MLLQCHMTLHSEEEEFVFECFALLQELFAHEERFVYRRGLLDGVAQLKALGVIE